jgi:hypothetical protein
MIHIHFPSTCQTTFAQHKIIPRVFIPVLLVNPSSTLTGITAWQFEIDARGPVAVGCFQVLHPSGRYAITANGGGQLSRWTGSTDVLEAAATRLQPPSAGQDDQGSVVRPRQETEEQSAAAAPAAAAALTSSTDVIKEPFVTLPDAGDVAVDCLRFITSEWVVCVGRVLHARRS